MVAYRMMELDRTKRWKDASDYDLDTVTRLIDLANAVPEHHTLSAIESDQVRDPCSTWTRPFMVGVGGSTGRTPWLGAAS